jgi:hypothetical protein
MATSGSLSNSYRGWTYKIEWSAKQSIENNQSVITCVHKLVLASSYSLSINTRTNSCTVGGVTKSYSSPKISSSGNTTITLGTTTHTISHNSDGTKSVSINGTFNIDAKLSGVQKDAITVSGTITLDTIPRKSTLSVGNGTLDTEQTLTVTRKSTNFTHTIIAACGSASKTIVTKSKEDSVKFTPPIEWAEQNTEGTSVSVKYTITTYNGNTNIGSNSYTKTCSIPAKVKPSCIVAVTDPTGYKDTYGKAIKGLSKLSVVVTPTTSHGSAIESYKVTANGNTYSKASFTTDFLKSSGSLKVNATVTDKRGRTSDTASANVDVYDYVAPSILKMSVVRCKEDGTGSSSGAFLAVKFDASVTSLDNQNTAIYTVQYKKTSETTYSNPVELTDYSGQFLVSEGVYIFPADASSSYDVLLKVEDDFGNIKKAGVGSSIKKLWSSFKKGLGFAFGKIAELEGVFDIGFKTRFTGGILQPVLESNSDFNDLMTPNTYTLKTTASANYLNCPLLSSATGTLTIEECGEVGQIRQVCTTCSKTMPERYERYYYQSSWGEWLQVSGGRSIITAHLSSNLTISTAQLYTQIPLDKELSIGNGLTVSNNAIKIGAGVKYVKVNVNVAWTSIQTSVNKHIRIKRNNDVVGWNTSCGLDAGNLNMVLADRIISVSEGDLLTLYAYSNTANDIVYAGSSANGWQTYITVEEVNTLSASSGGKAETPVYNPEALTINGTVYDGSEAVSIDTREFVFNVTMDEGTGECEIDVTAEEFLSAYNSGRTMACVFNGVRLPMFTFIAEDGWFQFLDRVGAYGFECDISARGNEIKAEGYMVEGLLTIGEENWNGIEPVDFTDTINQMIDDKIENVEVEPFKPSVKNYGAKGDGTTDDTSAFQDALANNRLVYVPEGNYVVSDTLVIRENCELELAQSVVLNFTQTDKNCITMLRLSRLTGNHATIFVPYTFSKAVINADTGEDDIAISSLMVEGSYKTMADANAFAVPPFKRSLPQWKMSRYVTDINICKLDHRNFPYSVDGDCYGSAVYIHCDQNDFIHYMWGVNMSGLRISGGFNFGIHIENEGETEYSWNHDMRIEALIENCKTGVKVVNCHNAHLNVTIQPHKALKPDDKTEIPYAEYGIYLKDSNNVDLSQSCVWDWDANNTKWTSTNEYQFLSMYGDCHSTILSAFQYHTKGDNIRDFIYTNNPSNFDSLIVLQEPITKWFKPVDGKPYFFNGYSHKELTTQEEFKSLFDTTTVAKFTNQLPIATDADGTIYNGKGYKSGTTMSGTNPPTITNDGYGLLTGFIPVSKGATIRFSDLWWKSDSAKEYYCRIFFFKEEKVAIQNGTDWALYSNYANINTSQTLISNYQESDNGFSFTLGSDSRLNDVAYIRVNFYRGNIGAKPIITVNEEIEYEQVGVLSDGIKIKSENVVGDVTLTSPNGTLYKIVVNDDGTLSTTQ